MPEFLAHTLGREFTSVFENLKYCECIKPDYIREINEVYPIRLAHIVTFDLEKEKKKANKNTRKSFVFLVRKRYRFNWFGKSGAANI